MGGNVVTEAGVWQTDVLVENGKIVMLGQLSEMTADESIDASGCWVLPGGIDVHTHLDWDAGAARTTDDLESGTKAALYGGTTSVMTFIQPEGNESLQSLVGRWREKASQAQCHYGFHVILPRFEPAWIDELEVLPSLGVRSIKVFTAYPGTLMLSDAEIFQILRRSGQAGILTMIHAENGPMIDKLAEESVARGQTTPKYHAATRPAVLEGEAVFRMGALARVAAASAYIVHISSKEAVLAFQAARELGAHLDGETCPQYLFLDESVYGDGEFNDVAGFVYTPPSRAVDDIDVLWQSLKSQDIGIIASDHCPFDVHGSKQLGQNDFRCIPNGGPGIETRVPLVLDYALAGQISMVDAMGYLATNPAKKFGMYPQKGVISPGADADLIIVDPQKVSSDISPNTLHQHVDYTPYAGRSLKGFPRDVLVNGQWVIKNWEWNGDRQGYLQVDYIGDIIEQKDAIYEK